MVAGLVVPDHFRLDGSTQVLERKAGRKRVAIHSLRNGGHLRAVRDKQPWPGLEFNQVEKEVRIGWLKWLRPAKTLLHEHQTRADSRA